MSIDDAKDYVRGLVRRMLAEGDVVPDSEFVISPPAVHLRLEAERPDIIDFLERSDPHGAYTAIKRFIPLHREL